MATKCWQPLRGRRIRVTRLDGCGRPVYGEASRAVTKGFITINVTANLTETEAVTTTNADGDVTVLEPAKQEISGYSVEIQFEGVDPDVFSLITGQPVVLDAFGNAVGLKVDTALDLDGQGFSLELWTGVKGTESCATPGLTGSWGYLLWPFLAGGVLGDFTVENAALNFTITNATSRDGGGWGLGPYDVTRDALGDPSKLLAPMTATEPFAFFLTELAPPPVACGARPLMDPSVDPLTAVTETGSGLSWSFAFLPADLVEPVYIDFGDGQWDYVIGSSGVVAHDYEVPGTYTVIATTNGQEVTTEVVATA